MKTVGKTYMACAGLELVEGDLTEELRRINPVKRCVDSALEMLEFVKGYQYVGGKSISLKVGIHVGNCIFGVIGFHKPQFSLIGDTINTTSRHCSTGDPNTIILSETAWNQIRLMDKYKPDV
jgi:class 3 adenylate cyclase